MLGRRRVLVSDKEMYEPILETSALYLQAHSSSAVLPQAIFSQRQRCQ